MPLELAQDILVSLCSLVVFTCFAFLMEEAVQVNLHIHLLLLSIIGVGPICVAKHLTPYLPTHPVVNMGEFGGSKGKGIGPISAAPFGSSSILPISYVYIQLMGGAGLTKATQGNTILCKYVTFFFSGFAER